MPFRYEKYRPVLLCFIVSHFTSRLFYIHRYRCIMHMPCSGAILNSATSCSKNLISPQDTGEIKNVPRTAFHLGPNKARFKGVATKAQVTHSRCILVGPNKMVYPWSTDTGKMLPFVSTRTPAHLTRTISNCRSPIRGILLQAQVPAVSLFFSPLKEIYHVTDVNLRYFTTSACLLKNSMETCRLLCFLLEHQSLMICGFTKDRLIVLL